MKEDGFDVSGSHPLPNAGTKARARDGDCGCRTVAPGEPAGRDGFLGCIVAAGCLALRRRGEG